MKTCKLLLVIVLSFSAYSYSQTEWKRSLFVSASGGFYNINSASMRETFGTEYAPAIFLGVGLPLGNRANIYINANYFSLKGSPIAYKLSMVNGQLVSIEYRSPGSITYTQYQLNFGVLYCWELKEDFIFGLNIGMITHHYGTVTSTPTLYFKTNDEYILGLQISAVLEHPIGETRFSWFAEPGFHRLIRMDELAYFTRTDYSLQAGVRYYFLKRKGE